MTFHILIGVTGSVATIKLLELVNSIKERLDRCEITVVTTEKAQHFFDETQLPVGVKLYKDSDEWTSWKDRGDPVLHIDLTKWADLMVIAPLDANCMAKIATGLCDNLLLCTLRAWDFEKPIVFAPAMNTKMWNHPITSKHLATLKEWGFVEIPPISKTLMCGDKGIGAMATIVSIVDVIKDIQLKRSGSG